MGKTSRFQRGGMPDVPAHEREPDQEVLSQGHFGPRPGGRMLGFENIHPVLQEILVRMDDEEAENLKKGLNILVRLEPADFVRLRAVLKIITVLHGVWRVLKWSVVAFMAGLASVVLVGDQLTKVWGWVQSALKLVRG